MNTNKKKKKTSKDDAYVVNESANESSDELSDISDRNLLQQFKLGTDIDILQS